MKRRLLSALIAVTVVLVAALDFWTSAELVGSIIFTVPIALCALLGSKRLLWATASAAVLLTVLAQLWGIGRGDSVDVVISLVEDNASDEKLTLLAFKQCGVANEIIVARDGAEALAYLHGNEKAPNKDRAALPAIILLDLKLPRVDGLEVLRRIRADERTRLLPVVILTASKEEEDIVRSYALGANAYVRKPVEFAAFAEAAKMLGFFWLLLNEPAPAHP